MPSNYYRSDGWVKTTQGPAVPGAQIYVCLQPANVTPPITPPRTTPVPWVGPNPQALIYSDDGLTPITQPIITDGFGHYDFYVLPGLYTVVVMYNNVVQQVYVDQSIGNVGSSLGSSVLFSTNGTPNFNQLVQNLIQGTGIILSTDNFGNTTISGTVSSVTVLAQPQTSRFALWQASPSSLITPTSDTVATADSGALAVYNPASATAGDSFTISAVYGGGAVIDRQYVGQPFAYTPRLINCQGILGVNNLGADTQTSFWGLSDINSGAHLTSGNAIGVIGQCNAGIWENWQLYTAINGGGSTFTDTGVPVVPGARYKFSFTVINGGTQVQLSINGVLVATTTATVPTATLGLCWDFERNGGIGATGYMTFEYLYADNVTP